MTQWRELVEGTVSGSAMLQVELIDQLVNYLDMDEAARWAKYCKIPADQLPHQILHLVDNAERFVSEILLYKKLKLSYAMGHFLACFI